MLSVFHLSIVERKQSGKKNKLPPMSMRKHINGNLLDASTFNLA